MKPHIQIKDGMVLVFRRRDGWKPVVIAPIRHRTVGHILRVVLPQTRIFGGVRHG